jgi:hypothetical protein
VPPWLLPRFPQVAACAALTNLPYINSVRDALLSERSRLFDELASISWLQPYPSQANFILCKVTEVRPVSTRHEHSACTISAVSVVCHWTSLLQGRGAKAVKDSTASTLLRIHCVNKLPAIILPGQSVLRVALLQGRDAKAVMDSTASTLPTCIGIFKKPAIVCMTDYYCVCCVAAGP